MWQQAAGDWQHSLPAMGFAISQCRICGLAAAHMRRGLVLLLVCFGHTLYQHPLRA
jgi:hypothetical protein